MNAEFKSWVESIGFDADNLTETQRVGLEANFAGNQAPKISASVASNPFEARKMEAKRRQDIQAFAGRQIETRSSDLNEINEIEKMVDHAIEAGQSVQEFKNEFWESIQIPQGRSPRHTKSDKGLTSEVVEAAICQAGRLPGIEEQFSDQVLQAAHTEFKGRIGLKDVLFVAAEANGHSRGYGNDVNQETLRAAFGSPSRSIHASGFSTLSISTIVSNTANKFIMRGWNMMEQTCLRIAKIQNVRDFKTITTVSLTDSAIYEKVGAAGEIKHGTLSELTYTNKADTYARMLAITRQDIINDDLGALTDVPMKLGNGAMKKLNDIFWTEFLGLVSGAFFASGNINLNEGVATVSAAGLKATETIFHKQTNPDGTPLGVPASIWLVPRATFNDASTVIRSSTLIDGTSTALQGNTNVLAGRYRVETSDYIHNSSYTGNTEVGNWLLADPELLPVIAIAALFGRVEPVVDTAEADFNVLGIQMRGYSDVGVNSQEYRGGVYADGGAS